MTSLPRCFPLKLMRLENIAITLIIKKAIIKRVASSVKGDAAPSAILVKRKLKPNSRLATSVAIMPSVSFFEPILFPMPYSIT